MTDIHEHIKASILPVLQPYVERIAVFGSVARGDAGPDSDVDILVALRPPGERPRLGLQWFSLEAALSEKLGRRVDLVSETALSKHMRPFVEKEAVVLYEAG